DAHLMDGRTVAQRITWKNESDGVRESAVLSKDGGKTWAPAFDVVFRKHPRDRGCTHVRVRKTIDAAVEQVVDESGREAQRDQHGHPGRRPQRGRERAEEP